jgi:hypothetical protein
MTTSNASSKEEKNLRTQNIINICSSILFILFIAIALSPLSERGETISRLSTVVLHSM